MISIREMKPDERKQVLKFMRGCFPLLMRFFLSVKGKVFLACEQEEIIGGTVLSTVKLSESRSIGIVSWLFTSPKARGKGAAGELLDRAMKYFQEIDCSEVTAVVEGYNTPSSNRFAGIGFTRLSAIDQIRIFGLHLPKVLLNTLHFFDIGHYLWYAHTDHTQMRSTRVPEICQWIFTLFSISLIMALLFGLSWTASLASATLFLGIRQASMFLAWKLLSGTPVSYRCWGTGTAMSVMIALLFGGLFPALGGTYPREDMWSLKEYRRVLGISGAAGSSAVLAAALALRFLFSASGGFLGGVSHASGFLLFPLILFDNLMPFFPFSIFSSGRILEYSKRLYAVTALSAAGVLYLLYFH